MKESIDPNLQVRTTQEHNEYITKLESEHKVILSILIATTKDRRDMFNNLCQEFYKQIDLAGFAGSGLDEWYVKVPAEKDGVVTEAMAKARYRHKAFVELKHIEDEREMSIGNKRQALLEMAKGKYIVFFDSDDFPKPEYVEEIMKAIEFEPDCVGFKIQMTTNGEKPQTCIHSLSNKEWKTDGGVHYRNCTHFNPILKDLALEVGFEDKRWGEDRIYSDKVSAICKKEIFIDKFLFDYRYSNKTPHNIKYGIK